MFTKLKASNKFILYSLLLLIFVFIFTRYNGNSHSDNRQIWQFLENQLQFDIYEQNLIFDDSKIGDLMHISLKESKAIELLVAKPPDLTLEARLRSP